MFQYQLSCNEDKNCAEFQRYHKHHINRIVHILSFLFGFAAFALLLRTYSIPIVVSYFGLIYLYWNDLVLVVNILLYFIAISILLYNSLNLLTPSRYHQVVLFGCIATSYLIPEVSHVLFNESTYLYQRLYTEKSILSMLHELLAHIVNLVPYSFVTVF